MGEVCNRMPQPGRKNGREILFTSSTAPTTTGKWKKQEQARRTQACPGQDACLENTWDPKLSSMTFSGSGQAGSKGYGGLMKSLARRGRHVPAENKSVRTGRGFCLCFLSFSISFFLSSFLSSFCFLGNFFLSLLLFVFWLFVFKETFHRGTDTADQIHKEYRLKKNSLEIWQSKQPTETKNNNPWRRGRIGIPEQLHTISKIFCFQQKLWNTQRNKKVRPIHRREKKNYP